jgi:hypothetical protein
MTAIERARRFIQNKGRAIAFTVVPLASLTGLSVPARASITFVANACNDSAVNQPGAGNTGNTTVNHAHCTSTNLASGGLVNGVSISGTDVADFTETFHGPGQNPNTFGMTFVAGGQIVASGGGFNGNIPISWDAAGSINEGLADGIGWSVQFLVNGVVAFSTSFHDVSGSGFSGNNHIHVDLASGSVPYVIQLSVLADAGSTGELTATIPFGTSVDVDSVPAPEPSTWALVLSALSGLLWWRRRPRLKTTRAISRPF